MHACMQDRRYFTEEDHAFFGSIRDEIATKDIRCNELTQEREEMQKKEENVNKAIANTKSVLEELKDMINELKSQMESPAAQSERKKSHKCWFLKKQNSSELDPSDYQLLNEMIEDAEKALNEAEKNTEELNKEIVALINREDQLKSQLMSQQKEKCALQAQLKIINEKIIYLEADLEEKRKYYAEKLEVREKKEERTVMHTGVL